MRTVICKHGRSGYVTPMADSAISPLPNLPPLDRHGIDLRRGHDTGYYRIGNVPDDVPVVEVTRRLNRTAIWGVWEIPYHLLDDGRGAYWRFLTPESVAAHLPASLAHEIRPNA